MSADQDLNNAEVEPSDFLRKRRHKAVNDLRESVYRARMRAYDAIANGVAKETADDIIRTAVENYVTELEPLLVNTEQGQDYWFNANLGTIHIYPPQDGHDYEEAGYEYELQGLVDFQTCPERFSEHFTTRSTSLVSGDESHVVLQEVAIPEHISWNAFRYANQFAYEIGLDIDHKSEIAVEADPF